MWWRYVIRRTLSSMMVIIIVPIVVFFLARMTGDPVALMTQPEMTPEQVEELRSSLGFDGPMYVQFLTFASNAIRGDFGDSLWQNRPAVNVVAERLPATMLLASTALFFSIVIALPIGAIAARWYNTAIDRMVMLLALIGQSVPNFWLGLMLILVLAVNLGWLPTSGYGETPGARVTHIILPTVTLGLFTMARLARLTRSALLEVLAEDYVRTARAKGLREWRVFHRHALRNSLVPIITILALDLGALLSGAVITETIFAWPGVGRLMFQAIERRDFPVIQVGVIVLGVTYTLLNLLADLLYAWVDPKIRFGE